MTANAMRFYEIHPTDAWFFRDGRPLDMDESNAAGLESYFPPFPPTLVGGVRAALARQQGWSGEKSWSDEAAAVLGRGAEEVGALSFAGPFLIRKVKDSSGRVEPLYPAPLHLLGTQDGERWRPATFLTPGEGVHCDLGEIVRLPEPVKPEPGLKTGEDLFLTRQGMEKALAGQKPDPNEVECKKNLWILERRPGIRRGVQSHVTGDNAYFCMTYVRHQPGVSLAFGLSGLPTGWELPKQPFLMGGQARTAMATPLEQGLAWPAPPQGLDRQFAIVFLTPADFGSAWPTPDAALPGLDGVKLVSACLGKPVWLGGWHFESGPQAKKPLAPAGSVLFCEADSPDTVKRLQDCSAASGLGLRTAMGFGRYALGVWPK